MLNSVSRNGKRGEESESNPYSPLGMTLYRVNETLLRFVPYLERTGKYLVEKRSSAKQSFFFCCPFKRLICASRYVEEECVCEKWYLLQDSASLTFHPEDSGHRD